jgi:hypothetical protein
MRNITASSLEKRDKLPVLMFQLSVEKYHFGLKARLKTYLNEELFENEHLYVNPGSDRKTIKIKASGLLRVLENPIKFR